MRSFSSLLGRVMAILEAHPYLKSYPHHQHDDKGQVKASPLTGDPVKDIKFVLDEIDSYLSEKTG